MVPLSVILPLITLISLKHLLRLYEILLHLYAACVDIQYHQAKWDENFPYCMNIPPPGIKNFEMRSA